MDNSGGCFCGDLRYRIEGDVLAGGLCCCASCQTFTGGAANPTVAIPAQALSWVGKKPAEYQKSATGALRQFCPACGTHITAQDPALPGIMTVKVGTFDDPSHFAGPTIAIWTADKPAWLPLPENILCFEGRAPAP